MVIEAYQKAQEAVEDRKNPPKPQGPTMQSILASQKDSQLFGSMLQHENSDTSARLAARLAEGNLTEGDVAELEEYRAKFYEKTERAKEVANNLTAESVKQFARNSPELQAVLGMVGPEKAATIIKSHLSKLCIEDEGRFNGIADALKTVKDFKEGVFSTLDREVSGILHKHKVDEREYVDALRITNPDDRQEELRRIIRSKYNMFHRMFTSGKGRLAAADRLSNSKQEMDDMLKMLNANMSSVGEVLATTVDQNQDVRQALADEMVGEKTPAGPKAYGFKEMQGEKKKISEADIEKDWEEFKGKIAGWDTMADPDKDTQRNLFRTAQEKKYKEQSKGGQGFWANVFELLFKHTLKNKQLN